MGGFRTGNRTNKNIQLFSSHISTVAFENILNELEDNLQKAREFQLIKAGNNNVRSLE